jgi:hypothetical protein
LTEIVRRFPCTWLTDNEPERVRSILFRGLKKLTLTLA